MSKTETVPISTRVPLKLKQQLHEMAKTKNMQLSHFILQLLVNESNEDEQARKMEEKQKVVQASYEKDLTTLKKRYPKHSEAEIIKAALECANENEQSLFFMEKIGAYLTKN